MTLNAQKLIRVLVAFSLHFVQVFGKCGHPAVPLNARVSLSNETLEAGTKATYSCDAGYELFGSSSTSCGVNGIWQGNIPVCGTNVAARKPVNQSTSVRGGQAANGNDGDKTTVHDGKRCTETQKEPSPWWQVNLLAPYPITHVRITTRGCCGQTPLQDLEIRVGNSSTDHQRNPLCAWAPDLIEEGVTKVFECKRTLIGQFVSLQLVSVEGSLSLCEVEVFTPEEFSSERCAVKGVGSEVDYSSFSGTCYEFDTTRGGSFAEGRETCKSKGGDLVHALTRKATTFLLGELDRRKTLFKTKLIWIGAQKEPGITSRTWKWVNGEVIGKPAWGKDQPNNYNGEQNCVVLDGANNWLWNDVGCNLDYLPWVCQYSPSKCGSPDKRINTTIEGSDYSVGAAIMYMCPEGHMLVGSQNRTCQKNGFWSGQSPTCKFVDCGEIGELEHGTVSLEGNKTWFGVVATLSCHANYTLVGENTRTCGPNGIWSGSQPQCLFDWCGDPPEGEGANVVISGRKTGSTATYTCQQGFILFGQQVLTCGLGGVWSGKPPVCRYVDCREPPAIENGRYDLLNGTTTVGSMAKYTCSQDYWFENSYSNSLLVCLRDGRWSDPPPSCQIINCGEPELPQDGFVVGYDFFVHSKIDYHCDAGFLLMGSTSRTCHEDGEWDGEAPACQYVDCGKIPPIPNGNVRYINETTYLGSVIEFSCTKNYKLVGPKRRQCQENGQWSETLPRCEEIRCPEPVLANHAILSVTGNDRVYGRTLIKTADSAVSVTTYKIGALVKYRCERGYKIEGDPLSTCEDSGKWSGQIPQCVFVDCKTPTAPAHGKFVLPSNVTYYGSAVLYECEENFQLDGFARRLCLENGTWNGETPACMEILCKEPEKEGGMSVRVSTYSVGGVAHYACPKGFNMQGNATRICLKKGLWSGFIPKCIPVDCENPGTIDNGRIIIMNDSTTYNSAVEYHCVPQYQRIGPYLRKCMEDGTWSGEEPRCELTIGPPSESQTLGLAIGIGAGVVLFLLLILGIIYLRLRKEQPVKNTENIQGAMKKEDQNAAVMSYANLNDPNNIYENIHEETYDSPYEETSHYEPSPISKRSNGVSTVTINGVAVR